MVYTGRDRIYAPGGPEAGGSAAGEGKGRDPGHAGALPVRAAGEGPGTAEREYSPADGRKQPHPRPLSASDRGEERPSADRTDGCRGRVSQTQWDRPGRNGGRNNGQPG